MAHLIRAAAAHETALVVERDFACLSRFQGPARGLERLVDALKGFHLIAFVMLM